MFSWTSTKEIQITRVPYNQNAKFAIKGNADNWKILWALQEQPVHQQITMLNKANMKPVQNQGPHLGGRGGMR
jgi:hypothetical protein